MSQLHQKTSEEQNPLPSIKPTQGCWQLAVSFRMGPFPASQRPLHRAGEPERSQGRSACLPVSQGKESKVQPVSSLLRDKQPQGPGRAGGHVLQPPPLTDGGAVSGICCAAGPTEDKQLWGEPHSRRRKQRGASSSERAGAWLTAGIGGATQKSHPRILYTGTQSPARSGTQRAKQRNTEPIRRVRRQQPADDRPGEAPSKGPQRLRTSPKGTQGNPALSSPHVISAPLPMVSMTSSGSVATWTALLWGPLMLTLELAQDACNTRAGSVAFALAEATISATLTLSGGI